MPLIEERHDIAAGERCRMRVVGKSAPLRAHFEARRLSVMDAEVAAADAVTAPPARARAASAAAPEVVVSRRRPFPD